MRNGRPSISGESTTTSDSGEREEYGQSVAGDVVDPVEDREVRGGGGTPVGVDFRERLSPAINLFIY